MLEMAEKTEELQKFTFLVDYKVGTKKDGSPKKIYLKGKAYTLDEGVATYLKSKNIIK